LRQIRASLRDTWLLLREFGWPLAIFIFAIVGGGISYFYLSHTAGEAIENIPKALYLVLSLTFMQPSGDFPRTWYLEVFYFLMPLIGVIIFSHGIAEFGAMFFNRHQRSREWEMAVSSTFSNHHVLVGLGHLGYRVACYLHDLGQDVVVVELNPAADLVENVKKMGIPVIQDDAKREPTLVGAGIARARTIILCTQNDSLNLQVALTARRLNKEIHVLLRIFDEEFARALNEQFGFTALSATQMAAPVFASTAAGIEITHPITIEGKPLSLAQLKLTATSKFAEMSIASVEQKFDISVVLLRRNHQLDFHPAGHILLQAEDSLAILGGPAEIAQMAQENL
jgi:Trk K+ transport system NAD-binding subunit